MKPAVGKKDDLVLHNSNLIRLKSNKLGSSAPNLCSTLVSLYFLTKRP